MRLTALIDKLLLDVKFLLRLFCFAKRHQQVRSIAPMELEVRVVPGFFYNTFANMELLVLFMGNNPCIHPNQKNHSSEIEREIFFVPFIYRINEVLSRFIMNIVSSDMDIIS